MADRSGTSSEVWRTLEKRVYAEWLVVTLFTLTATALLSFYSEQAGIARIDHTFYDSALRLGPRSPASEDIVIIMIDDASIEELGYWPWRRKKHAELLERLSEARRVGFDVVFSDPNPAFPNDDAVFAEAIARHGRVVLPTIIVNDPLGRRLQAPLPELAQAAARLGYINVYPDSDGTIRSLMLQQKLADGRLTEHFIVAMHDEYPSGTEQTDGRLLVPYAGPAGHFNLYPYASVLRGEVPPGHFRDRIVLIGAWASGLGDAFPTPMTVHGEAMSGVEVLANGLQALGAGNWIRILPAPAVALLSCVPVLMTCLAFRRFSPRQSFLAALIILLAWCGFAIILLLLTNVWLPITASLIGVTMAFPLWNWRSQEVSLQHIDHELHTLQQANNVELAGSDGLSAGVRDRSLPARVRLLHQAIHHFRDARRKREETVRFLSHDMRAPQNAILALVRLQQREPSARDAEEVLEHIERRATETLELMDGFVQLERAEVAPLEQQVIQLTDLIHEACDAYWVVARRRHIALVTDDLPEYAWAKGDRGLLSRALRNLLDNALKYSPDHTEVRCGLTRAGANWNITLQDQGRGIAPSQIRLLFNPFLRVAADSQGNPDGAGLGLAFVRAAVERHGGTVFAHSEEGRGSTFTLSVPALSDDEATDDD